MKIYVNDSEKIVSENYNLQSLLEEMNLSDLNGWAVAINKEIITADDVLSCSLCDEDHVLLFQATQGG